MLLTEILERKKQYLEMMANNTATFLKHIDFHLKYAYEIDEADIPENGRDAIKHIFAEMDKFYGQSR